MKNHMFAANFTTACKEADLPPNQDSLGKVLGVSGVTIHYWRTGKKLPSMEKGIIISGKTGVCLEWLYTGRGPKHPGAGSNSLDDVARTLLNRIKMLPPQEVEAIQNLIDVRTRTDG